MSEAKAAAASSLDEHGVAEEDNPDKEVAVWVKERHDAEAERVQALGQRVLPIAARNFCVQRKGKRVINRIECATGFDFAKVTQIMVSEPTDCPLKPGAGGAEAAEWWPPHAA